MLNVNTQTKPCRILLIEDDDDDVFLIRRALDQISQSVGCEIECQRVSDGLDGLMQISRNDLMNKAPDAVILDINMPRFDGLRFLRSLRRPCAFDDDTPVFVLTTSTTPEIHNEAVHSGANRVFIKPNSATGLMAIAQEIVEAVLNGPAVGQA